MAMKLGSNYRFSEVQARHWDQFAQSAGLSVAQTRKRIRKLAEQLPPMARRLQADPERGFAGHPLVEQIIALIEQRAALTIRRLTDPAADVEPSRAVIPRNAFDGRRLNSVKRGTDSNGTSPSGKHDSLLPRGPGAWCCPMANAPCRCWLIGREPTR